MKDKIAEEKPTQKAEKEAVLEQQRSEQEVANAETALEAVKNGQRAVGEPERIDFGKYDYFDFRYNEDWRGVEPQDAKIERRGGVLHQVPAGWKRFAIKCKDLYDLDLGEDRNK